MIKNVKVEIWQRRKQIYERHRVGETFVAIARDLEMKVPTCRAQAAWWAAALAVYEGRKTGAGEYADEFFERLRGPTFDKLEAAGLLGAHKRSPQYGYA